MQNKGDFAPFNMKALIYQIVTNFKNTRIFCTIVQNFCVDGTHNVKYHTKKRTKQDKKMERIWGLAKMKRDWKQIVGKTK